MKYHEVASCHVRWTANMAWPGPLSDGLQKHDPAHSIDRSCKVLLPWKFFEGLLHPLPIPQMFPKLHMKQQKGQKYAKVRSVQKRHLHWLNMCFLISSDHNNNWLMLFRQVRVCFKNMFVPAKLILLLHIGHEAREHVFPRSALEFVRLQQVKVAMLHPL